MTNVSYLVFTNKPNFILMIFFFYFQSNKKVVLLEKSELTAGSTWHAAGLVTLFHPVWTALFLCFWKYYILSRNNYFPYWNLDKKSWLGGLFFMKETSEKNMQINFSSRNFSCRTYLFYRHWSWPGIERDLSAESGWK